MLKTLKVILIVATLAVAIIFAVANSRTVLFNFLFGAGEIRLYVLLFIFFLAGLVFAFLLDGWIMLRQRQRIRGLSREVETARSELNNLRKLPLKDFGG